MKIVSEISLQDFEAWNGGKDTLNRLIKLDNEGYLNIDTLENHLEEIFPDGMEEVELNDLLWFDNDLMYEFFGFDIWNLDKEEEEKKKKKKKNK